MRTASFGLLALEPFDDRSGKHLGCFKVSGRPGIGNVDDLGGPRNERGEFVALTGRENLVVCTSHDKRSVANAR